MSALFGSSSSSSDTNAQDVPTYTQIQVNTSAYGIAVPIIYGTTRVGNNLGWYANFQAITTSSGSSSGGGGGKGGIVGGGGKGCLAGEVIISTPFGNCRIDSCYIGQEIWSFDPITKKSVIGIVKEVLRHETKDTGDKMLHVHMQEQQKPLHLTENHYPWIDGLIKQEIKDFAAGETLWDKYHRAIAIERIESAPDIETTWNLVVEPHHNFFAEGFLLHNGGGGGGGKGATSTTTYQADIILLLGEGPIINASNMWNSQTLIAGLGTFSLFDGALGQAGWGYLAATYPTEYSNYSGIAYLSSAAFQLGTSANLPNFNFEVEGIFEGTTASTYGGNGCEYGGDADPSLVVPDLLTNGQYGLGFPTSRIGTLINNYETHAVPGSGPYHITVANASSFKFNEVVALVSTGALLTCCPNASNQTNVPNANEYSFSAGVYVFNVAQAGASVNIGYASLESLSSPSSTFSFKDFALAAGLWISPAYVTQSTASSMMDDIATACYSEFVWTSGVLTVVPRGAQDITANGSTYTANTNILFSLGIDDFMKNQNPYGTLTSGVSDDPVIVSRTRASDQINDVKIEWLDRANQYAPSIAEATDQALIDRYGKRTSSPKSLHMFCDANAANTSAYFQLQDQYIRNSYSIQVDERYCVLDPMDLIELTDPNYPGLTNVPVRIKEVEENDDGTLSIVAEEYPGTVGIVPTHSFNVGSGFITDFNAAPGSVNTPVIFGFPINKAYNDGLAIGAALSGSQSNWGGCHCYLSSDGSTYAQLAPTQYGPARMGYTTADFPVGSDPDTVNTLNVNLMQSLSALVAGTDTDADQNNTLCLVGGTSGVEFIAYSDITLTSANNYALGTYIRRGQQSTPIVDHPAGSPFCRIDQQIYQIPYDQYQIGQTVYMKFTSFNVYGGGEELLSNVTEYTFVIPEPPNPPDVTGFAASQVGTVVELVWNPVDYPTIALAGYDYGYAPQGTTDWNDFTMLGEASNVTQSATVSLPAGSYTFGIRAANVSHIIGTPHGIQPTNGLSPDTTTFDLVIVNTNPIIYDADEAATAAPNDGTQASPSSGWAGTLTNCILHYTNVLVPLGTNAWSTYSSWSDFPNTILVDPVSSCSYKTAAIDTGYDDSLRVFNTSNTFLAPGQSAGATVAYAIDTWLTGGSDPNTFTPWTVGVVTMRYLRSEINVTGLSNGDVICISDFTPMVDTTPSVEQSNGAVTVAALGTAITYPTLYHLAPALQVTATSSGATSASAVSVTATGFVLHVWTGSSDTGGTASWFALGE